MHIIYNIPFPFYNINIFSRGQRAFIASDSVNYGIEKKLSNCVMLHCGAIHSEERRGVLVRDTSILSPITLLLFSNKV